MVVTVGGGLGIKAEVSCDVAPCCLAAVSPGIGQKRPIADRDLVVLQKRSLGLFERDDGDVVAGLVLGFGATAVAYWLTASR